MSSVCSYIILNITQWNSSYTHLHNNLDFGLNWTIIQDKNKTTGTQKYNISIYRNNTITNMSSSGRAINITFQDKDVGVG